MAEEEKSKKVAAPAPAPAAPKFAGFAAKPPSDAPAPSFSFVGGTSSAPAPAPSFNFGGKSSVAAPAPAAPAFSFPSASAPAPASAPGENSDAMPKEDPTQLGKEENTEEDLLLEIRTKYYRFKKGDGWKDRGVGILKCMKHKTSGACRIVMRNSIGKVGLNVAVGKGMEFEKVRLEKERSDDLVLHSAITNNLLLVASFLAPLFASLTEDWGQAVLRQIHCRGRGGSCTDYAKDKARKPR